MNNGVEIPLLGLGVYQMKEKEVEEAVLWALEAGYRHIDTAALYGNERDVGNAIKKSGIPREEIFVTTKLFPTSFLWTEAAFSNSLEQLGLDYIDLYLIHWPAPGKNHAWKSLERITESKLVKAIGVSNYSVNELEELLQVSKNVPAVNQIEFHPFLYREKLLNFCKQKKITVVSYSPLNRGNQLDHPIIIDMADRYGKTSAQIMLRWGIQHGTVVIPKSVRRERIRENSQIFDFELFPEDMDLLDSLTLNRDDQPS